MKRMSKNKQDDKNDKEVTPNKSRKTIAEKKLNLLSKCTETFTANAEPKPNESPIIDYLSLLFMSMRSYPS